MATGLVLAALLSVPAVLPAQAPAPVVAEVATAPLDQELPVSPAVTVGEFDNGVRYYIRENREPENRAELRLVVNVGSVLEDDDQLGLAHVLEHMAFNGTENFEKQALVAFMESIGMRLGPGINASTSFDETIYMLRLPTDDPAALETAFQIMEDWTHALSLESEEIDLERGVVIEEWRGGRGAQARIRDQQLPVILQGSRYAERLPIGTLESLQTFDHEALRRFYRDWYRPELMAVVAVGDFDADTVEGLVRTHFEGLPASESPRERTPYDVPDPGTTLYSIATDAEVPLTNVAVYHRIPAQDDWTVGGYRQRIVERLYNAMLNDRLMELTRQADAPLLAASSANGQIVRDTDAYLLQGVVPEGGVERGLEALLIEAERVARFGFTAPELARQKAAVLRGMEQSYANRENRNSSGFASEFIRAYLSDEAIPGIEYEYALYQRFVPEITLEDVNRVGRDWIADAGRVVVVTAPQKAGTPAPERAALESAIDAVARAEITPYEDAASDEPLLAGTPRPSSITARRTREGGVTEWTLANGITVVLKPTDFREDQITFRAFSPGGTSLADDADYVTASAADTLIANGGAGAFDATQLRQKLAGVVASVSPYIGEYDEGLQGSGAPQDLETLFQLIYLRVTAPRADETFFEVFRNQNRTVLANRAADPGAKFGDAFARLFYQDHLRRQPPTVEMLDELDLAQAMAFYQDRFADVGDFTFVFVGDLDLDAMEPLVETYLGGLPATGRTENWRDVGIRPPRGVVREVVQAGIEPRSQTRIAFSGDFDFASQAEGIRLRAMAQVLETRLRDLLREDLGGTYGVNVSPGTSWQPRGSYTLNIQFGSDPERAEELTARLFETIQAFKAGGPTEREVSDAKAAMLRSFETNLEQNGFWLGQLAATYEYDPEIGASRILGYEDAVNALRPDAVRAAAAQYLDLENYVQVVLMPEQ
jgi:zinc protease